MLEKPTAEGGMPVISVVIPTYGRPDRLRRLLEQLLRQQSEGFDYEIIVVDDGSPEPMCPIVQALGEQTNIRLRCLRKANGGPAAARNFGARAAQGNYLLFVDDDMSVCSDFIQAHLESQGKFGPGIVNCHLDWEVDALSPPLRRWYRQRIAGWNESREKNSSPVGEGVSRVFGSAVTSANLSILRADFERVGGFDTGYASAGCEDQDFSLRLWQVGIPAYLSRKTTATHVETHISLPLLCQRQRLGARDGVRFVRRFVDLCGQPSIAAVNGVVLWRSDSWTLIAKKALKNLVVSPYILPAVFLAIRILEHSAPSLGVLQRLYDFVVGAHIQTGWREGLKEYSDVPKLDLAPIVES